MEKLHLYLSSSSIAVIRENSYLLALVISLVICLALLLVFRRGLILTLRSVSIITTRFLDTILNISNRKTKFLARLPLLMLMHALASLLWLSVLCLCVLSGSISIPPYPVERRIRGSRSK